MTITTGYIEMGSSKPFNVDYVVVYYNWTNGDDLDQRTRLVSPVVSPYLGWSRPFTFPSPISPVIERSFDNIDIGYESVVLYVDNFVNLYPAATVATFEMRAYWYSVVGTNPVNIGVVAYRGGEMEEDLGTGLWINTTYDERWIFPTYPKIVTLQTTNPLSDGEFIRFITFDLVNTTVAYSET